MRQGLVGLALRRSLEVRRVLARNQAGVESWGAVGRFVVVVLRRLCLFGERGNGGVGVDGGAME